MLLSLLLEKRKIAGPIFLLHENILVIIPTLRYMMGYANNNCSSHPDHLLTFQHR